VRDVIIRVMKTSFPMINAICDLYDELRADGVYEDIAVSICSTDFATTHDITLKEARGIVGMALHLKLGVEIA